MPSIGQAKQAPAAAKVEEVVFTPAGRSNLDVMSKAEKRAFLVSHIAQQTVSIC
jgi:hypothetical protein